MCYVCAGIARRRSCHGHSEARGRLVEARRRSEVKRIKAQQPWPSSSIKKQRQGPGFRPARPQSVDGTTSAPPVISLLTEDEDNEMDGAGVGPFKNLMGLGRVPGDVGGISHEDGMELVPEELTSLLRILLNGATPVEELMGKTKVGFDRPEEQRRHTHWRGAWGRIFLARSDGARARPPPGM